LKSHRVNHDDHSAERASYEVIATVPGPDLMAFGVWLLLQVLIHPSTLPSTQMLCERFDLTRREAEVARCLAEGLSYARTADHLRISIDTVRSHVRSIYASLQVQSATEAVSRILRETW
jgi:DNA-binding CsgD family transcriptional regulator